jgi:hypothetical protein
MPDFSITDPYGQANHFFGMSSAEPPEPDNVAQRGTPEWRAAFDKRREFKANLVARGGGAGNPQKAAEILAKFTQDTATETGDELRKKIAHNRFIGDEVSQNASRLLKQANERQWWRGGAGASGDELLSQGEMDQITSGGYGSATGGRATPEAIYRWQQGLKSGMGGGMDQAPQMPQNQTFQQNSYSNPGAGGQGFYNQPSTSSMGPPSASPSPLASVATNPVQTPSATIGGGAGMSTARPTATIGGGYNRRRNRAPVNAMGVTQQSGMGAGLAGSMS